MSALEQQGSCLKQCQAARDQLDEAISEVQRAEGQLRDNTREVRGQLQTCVSRQLETLRSREVWLLEQINLHETLKQETLQQQLAQLHWLRGQFDVIAHQLEYNSTNHLTNQLKACMERLSSLNLSPEESPEMSFSADTRSLRHAITTFGCINTQATEVSPAHSLSSAPSQRTWLQQSCPVVAKKQKMETGPLADWLAGSRTVTAAPIGFQSSKDPQDWLIAYREDKQQPVCPLWDFYASWGQLKDLEAWLLKETAPPPTPPPPARERAASSASTASSSSFSIEKIDESEFTMTPDDQEGEEEEGDWLVTPATTAGVTTETTALSDAERWKLVIKPFQESWASSDWLQRNPSNKADCSSCCQTLSSSSSVEIENLGKLKCLKTPPPGSSPASSTPQTPTSSSPPSPPLSSSPSSTPSASALEAWLQKTIPIGQSCRANECCSSYSQCVCEENCGRAALSAWLLRHDGRDKNGVPVVEGNNSATTGPVVSSSNNTTKNPAVHSKPPSMHHKQQEQKVQAILEAWLHPNKTSSSTSSCSTPILRLLPASSLSTWVAAPSPAPAPSPLPEEEKASREEQHDATSPKENPFHSSLEVERWVLPAPPAAPLPQEEAREEKEEEEDKWLLKKRSDAQERLAVPTVCDLFSCMKIGGDKDKWLHQAPIQM